VGRTRGLGLGSVPGEEACWAPAGVGEVADSAAAGRGPLAAPGESSNDFARASVRGFGLAEEEGACEGGGDGDGTGRWGDVFGGGAADPIGGIGGEGASAGPGGEPGTGGGLAEANGAVESGPAGAETLTSRKRPTAWRWQLGHFIGWVGR